MARKGNSRILGARRKQREARAKAFERALSGWMKGYMNYQRRIAMERLKGKFSKQSKDDWFAGKLSDLMNMFGTRELGDSINSAAGYNVATSTAIADASRGKETQVKWFYQWQKDVEVRVKDIMQETKVSINNQVNTLVSESLEEVPMPSAGEVARRIRTQAFSTDNHVFSSKRAELIARTELAQAQNTGSFEGYKASGVKQIKWLAYKDGKSGDRHHERMNGVIINVGEYFETPLGARMKYPGDSGATGYSGAGIKETANCRCTVSPVI